MASRKRDPGARSVCAQVHDDDGVPPRLTRRERPRAAAGQGRKTAQLCAQVRRALHGLIGPGNADPALEGLRVEDVEPAPDSSRLRVIVSAPGNAGPDGIAAARLRLAALTPRLRFEVAGAISRKRVPELCFAVQVRAGEEP